jgi:hypothetical protein
MAAVDGTAALLRRLAAVGHTPDHLLDHWVPETVRFAKRNLTPHNKTKGTSRSIIPGHRGPHEAEVKAAGAAAFLEYGTAPHEIRPRNAKVLAWPAGGTRRTLSGRAARSGPAFDRKAGKFRKGAFVYAKAVHHPGTKPSPFLLPAAEEALGNYHWDQMVAKDWNEGA